MLSSVLVYLLGKNTARDTSNDLLITRMISKMISPAILSQD